jgi:UDP-N-acetylmuramoyl-tripeptide--D-alanyl-D-alanine ligase
MKMATPMFPQPLLERIYRHYVQCPVVTTDTRKIDGPCIFFALKGPNFDGNKFALQALEKGAKIAIVDDFTLSEDPRLIQVPDSLQALQALARHHRQQFHIPIIAITGSNGKTTTKELVSAVMGSHYLIHYTKGNLNNHIGVPLTLLAMRPNAEVAIIEMGANHQGEIAGYCEVAQPTHGIITNIGKAHLEGFGGIEGVKKGKSELYRYLAKTDGLVFINRDEKFLEDLAQPVRKKVFYKGSKQSEPQVPDFELVLLKEQPFLKVAFATQTSEKTDIQTQLMGTYNFGNIATAVALGRYFKVPYHKIKSAIENYHPDNNRSQLLKKGTNAFVLDAYNANPTSMEAAIRTFATIDKPNKIAILGDMLELGEDTQAEHQKMADLATSLIPEVYFVGPHFGAIPACQSTHFADVQALQTWLQQHPLVDATVLVKGSRGIKLEQLLQAL